MIHLRSQLDRLQRYEELASIGEIARRYFAMNSFDGILTILGVLVGNYLAGVRAPSTVIITGITTSPSMAASGLWGAYLTEAAERRRSLDDLEEYTLTDLSETRIGHASRLAVVAVAAMNGLAPLLASLLVVLPFFLTGLWGDILYSYYAAMGMAMVGLFGLGAFLGRISKQQILVAGLKMVFAGLAVVVLSFLIERVVHPR